MAHVQVYGPPEDRALEHDERLCSDPDRGELVIFHPGAALFGGGFICNDCGYDASEESASTVAQ